VHTIPYLGAAAVTAAVELHRLSADRNADAGADGGAVPLVASMLIGIGLQTVLMGPRRE
jgi:hypothetical protein